MSSGEDGTLRWWNGAGPHFDETANAARGSARRLAARGGLVVCGGDDGALTLWTRAQPVASSLRELLVPGKARALSVDSDSGAVRFAVDGALYQEGKSVYDRGRNAIVHIASAPDGGVVIAHKVSESVCCLLFCLLNQQKNGLLVVLDSSDWTVRAERRVASSVVVCAVSSTRVLVCSSTGLSLVRLADLSEEGSLPNVLDSRIETATACAVDDEGVLVGTSRGALLSWQQQHGEASVCWLRDAHSDAITDLVLRGEREAVSCCRDGWMGSWARPVQTVAQVLLLLRMERCGSEGACESFVGPELVRVQSARGASVVRLADRLPVAHIPKVSFFSLFGASLSFHFSPSCCLAVSSALPKSGRIWWSPAVCRRPAALSKLCQCRASLFVLPTFVLCSKELTQSR